MDILPSTPKKISFKVDIETVCIACSADINSDSKKKGRRLAASFKDSLSATDNDYGEIVNSLEKAHPRKIFICKQCATDLNKIEDTKKNLSSLKTGMSQKTGNFKQTFIRWKRQQTAILSPFARHPKFRKIAVKAPLSPSKLPIPTKPAGSVPSPKQTYLHVQSDPLTPKAQKQLFGNPCGDKENIQPTCGASLQQSRASASPLLPIPGILAPKMPAPTSQQQISPSTPGTEVIMALTSSNTETPKTSLIPQGPKASSMMPTVTPNQKLGVPKRISLSSPGSNGHGSAMDLAKPMQSPSKLPIPKSHNRSPTDLPSASKPRPGVLQSPSYTPLRVIYTPKPQTQKEASYVGKATVRYSGEKNTEKTKYFMQDCFEVKAMKALVERSEKRSVQLVNAAMSNEKCKEIMTNIFLKDLHDQCQGLCSTKNPSCQRSVMPYDLEKLQPKSIVKEWEERSPLLYKVTRTIIGGEKGDKGCAVMAVAGSMMLHERNKHMSAMQHSLGLVCDFGGTRDKTLSALANCGIVTATSTIYDKKKDIEEYHSVKVIGEMKKIKDTIEFNVVEQNMNQTVQIFDITGVNIAIMEFTRFIQRFEGSTDTSGCHLWDIFGDNLDFRKGVFHRTAQNQGEDIHWFLLLGAPLRVKPEEGLSKETPRKPIMTVPNSEFYPSQEDQESMRENLRFHVIEALVKYVPFLKYYSKAVPMYIDHEYVTEMSKRHPYHVVELLDKNESKNDDMLDIVQEVHAFIPFLKTGTGRNVMERLTFGGDVLTNERAYTAQLHVLNGTNEADRLLGIMHRPEGLHVNMNFCRYIMRNFYTTSSAADEGTLYQLAVNTKSAKDLDFEMTTHYNACRNFLNDSLDAHLTAAALKVFQMPSVNDEPQQHAPSPMLQHQTKKTQLEYLNVIADKVLDIIFTQSHSIAEDINTIEVTARSLQNMDNLGKFCCPFGNCTKKYGTQGWLKWHLTNKHNVNIQLVAPQREEDDASYDGVYNYATAFMKVALLYRDTCDAYKMGDGNRVFRNIRFLMLHFDHGHNIKYRLWMFRMLAYDLALLSDHERHIYRNNLSINMVGGARNCIANDNLVEIHVKKVKECMRAMGANLTFKATRRAAKCIGVVNAIMDTLATQRSGTHASTNTEQHVTDMVTILHRVDALSRTPGRQHNTFPNFANDVLNNVNLVDSNTWLTKQKERAHREMQM